MKPGSSFVDLNDAEITAWLEQLEHHFQAEILNTSLIQSFDSETLAHHGLLPLAQEQNILVLGATQINEPLSKRLGEVTGYQIRLFPISAQLHQKFVSFLHEQKPDHLIHPVIEPSVTEVFQRLLLHAQKLRASDIHLEPQLTPTVLVRFRIDGLLHDIETLESEAFDYRARLISKIKVAADLDIAETRVPQDGRITEYLNQEPVDLRVSTLPSMHGEKVVIRLLPHKNPFQEMRSLGLEGEALLTYYNWVKKPQGMVLITGQTGSGKTSTLYTTLSQIVHTEKNIVTIEDPIEYKLQGVTQVQVHPKVGLTFANGLRSILRQDPDIILLGEIRDHETAEIAYQAALTGHLVLSTLHTNDAPSAIIRLMDMQVEPYLIASATLGVVAQRLVRRVCPACAEPYTPGQDLIRSLGMDSRIEYLFYRAQGCEACFHTGYYGREGIFEVMPLDEELTNLMQQKDQLPFLRNHLQQKKIQSLYDSALSKVEAGLTTVEEIYRVVPPVQRNASPGSIFVFMLFLISILSILIINGFSLLGNSAQALQMERHSLQGSYAAYSALAIGQREFHEKLSGDTLYFSETKNETLTNPLLQVPELTAFLSQTHTVPLDDKIQGEYRIQFTAKPVLSSEQAQTMDYAYQLLAQGVQIGHQKEQIAPKQQLSGHFQIQIGPLPLSFFEKYTITGTLTPTNAGPCYSPLLPEQTVNLPRQGYYTQADAPFNSSIPDLKPNQRLSLLDQLWPDIGNATADQNLKPAQPSIYLTPIAHNQGASYPLLSAQTDQAALVPDMNPSVNPWAIQIHGNVERLVLSATADSQQMEIDQVPPVVKSQTVNGYQLLSLYKTWIRISKNHTPVEVTTQQWQLTLNPQHEITQQKQLSANRNLLQDHFSGLVLINGSVNELIAKGYAYSQPLTLYTSGNLGIATSLLRQPEAQKSSLGLVAPNGKILFSMLQAPPVSDWALKPLTSMIVEGAIAASQLIIPEKTEITVKGSVASLRDSFPSALNTVYDPGFYDLTRYPPFYPVIQTSGPALLVSKPPEHEHWEKVLHP